MSKAPIKLVLTDVDGTILPYGATDLSDRIISAMKACQEAGVEIGPASGRAIEMVEKNFRGHKELLATSLGTNAMQVFLRGELVYEAGLDVEAFKKLMAACEELGDNALMVFKDTTTYLVYGDAEHLRTTFPEYMEGIVDMVGQVPDFKIVKANISRGSSIDEDKELVRILEERVPEFDYTIPRPGFLNVHPKGVNKAWGIDYLCKEMDISLDEVCVFGDANNDVIMLEHVPCSVVVETATPDAMAAAKYVIGRCEDDTVADVLDRIAAGVFPFDDEGKLVEI